MSESLKIPDELLDKIYQAVDEQIGWTSYAEHAINIAVPLRMAAELRRLADRMDDWDDEQLLVSRANELDPEGLTNNQDTQ